ncbi:MULTISPECIES: hypothetical protein [unclassified Tardiphaga]|uniref:hypothetical protein n=1 Tax=unclassified Tardiphaga TaxID=2631404 RepID=UPI003F91DED3
MRYFDVALWYGFGLSERRFGHFLHNKNRNDYLLSSKVGKLGSAAACAALRSASTLVLMAKVFASARKSIPR